MSMESFMGLLQKHLSEKDFNRMKGFIGGMESDRRASMMRFLAERETLAPSVGTDAPDFILQRHGSAERIQLSSFQGKKPVALIFGSYT